MTNSASRIFLANIIYNSFFDINEEQITKMFKMTDNLSIEDVKDIKKRDIKLFDMSIELWREIKYLHFPLYKFIKIIFKI